MAKVPVIGQIRTHQDTQRALENIRQWLASNPLLSSSGGKSSTVIEKSNTVSSIGAVLPLVMSGGAIKINIDGSSFRLVSDNSSLSVNNSIFDKIISYRGDVLTYQGNVVYKGV